MPRTAYLPAAILALACSVFSTAQDAVQWRVEDGGNGHWYLMAASSGGSGISHYQQGALDAGGHLASINSEQESGFVRDLLGTSTASYVLGGSQSPEGSEPDDGWQWMDGSEWSYTNWLPNEPNDAGGAEDFIAANPDGRWNDVSSEVNLSRYAIEWSADCDGDGIVDYGQILDGTREDLDGNGVHDCCEDAGPCPCPADLDGDGQVRAGDLGILLSLWGTDGGKRPEADLDGSGTIDAADLGLMIATWGACL
ncbi:MAG: lectin-like protein [Planctomycetota bacterium]|nr:lectin-like protein [Planctomycetota bacterium]